MTGANISELDEARFARLVEAYGADPKRWPAAEREPAQILVSSNAAAQRLLAEARALDLALSSSPPPAISAALERRLLSDFDRAQRRWSLRKLIDSVTQIVWPGAPIWQPAAVFGLALAFGIALAILAPLDLRPSEDGSTSVFALDATPDSDAGQDI
jgi:hypothetical protein